MKPLFTSVLLVWFIASGVVSAQTSNTWTSARTNNLFLISNAGEEEMRKAAVWLEMFHEAFGRLLSRSVVDSSVPTTVILFKDDASFMPFKPLHQGKPANVAGYFQPGQDVNYVVFSLERGERSLFGISTGRGPNSYIPTQTARLSEAEANYYLGDLLLHIRRIQDAEKYFLHAISLDPNLTSAHASLGLLRLQQNRLADARKHFQRATTSPQTHLIHYYYAWILSTERSGPNSTFAPEVTAIMREELRKAIKLAPKFADVLPELCQMEQC